jgi:hypothetical protein
VLVLADGALPVAVLPILLFVLVGGFVLGCVLVPAVSELGAGVLVFGDVLVPVLVPV